MKKKITTKPKKLSVKISNSDYDTEKFMLKDEEITKYVNLYYFESEIIRLESQILYLLKLRQETYPSEKNNTQWLNFSDWVIKRKNLA